MIRILGFLSVGILSMASMLAHADTAEVNLSNDAVAAQYLIDLGQGLHGGLSALHEQDNGEMVSLDLIAQDDLRSGQHTFTAGVGGKLMGIFPKGDSNDGGSLALGGFVSYTIPQMRAVSLRGELYYGPSVTSTGEVDSVTIYIAGFDVEVIERAMLHAGYRKISVDFDNGAEGDLDEGFNVGVKLQF